MEPLLLQCGRSIACSLQASGENVADSKTGQWLTPMIDEDVHFRTEIDLSLFTKGPQDCRGLRPQWAVAFLLPFAEQSHLEWLDQLEVANAEIGDLLNASARVEHRR